MKITLKKKHIEEYIKRYNNFDNYPPNFGGICSNCPFAIAARELFPYANHVTVGYSVLNVDQRHFEAKNPKDMEKWTFMFYESWAHNDNFIESRKEILKNWKDVEIELVEV